MIQFLKKRNRTLLELWTGIVFLGIVCQAVGLVISHLVHYSKLIYSLSLWTGVLMCIASSIHMYHTLDRALDYDGGTATKRITAAYMTRYFVIVILFAVICITDYLNPLIVFLGYMTLKFGAFLQPSVHKMYNRLFGETDPIPVTEEEYRASLLENAETETTEGENIEAEAENFEAENVEPAEEQ